MTDQNQSLRDDIAFIRTMAEAGRDRPMIGGSILLLAGCIFGIASLAVWYVSAVLGLAAGWVPSAVMFPAFALYMPGLVLLLRRLPKSASSMQAATGVAWSGAGWAIFVIFLALAIASYRLDQPAVTFVFPAILLALYGAAWIVAAILLRQRWLRAVGAGSFVMALACAWVVGTHLTWLVFGLSLLALLAAPGFVLMRQSRKAA
jgi:hypothetical protein